MASDEHEPVQQGDPLGQQPDADHDRTVQPVGDEEPPRLPFPVVGIGASAGGLEAIVEFLQVMPPNAGMAYVFIQHLPPDRESLVPEILSRHTSMTVRQVEGEDEILPDHVYVIRPGHVLTINKGRLHLGQVLSTPANNRPVDDFFRSLAQEQRERAIVIIMSGMGSNGTAGAQMVKAVGGICIAQEPDSAKFPSMPRHLIDAGYADYIAAPKEIPDIITSYARHPYARDGHRSAEAGLEREHQHLREILALLRTRTNHDFSGYKRLPLLRRIQRRMGLSRLATIGEYARMLRQTPSEASALADDLLIHVTGFFRDPETWESLRETVIQPLVAAKENNSSIRAWVCACSSGEEAYSLAILLVEECERVGKTMDIKIFATDTSGRTLQNARQGIYPGGIEGEMAPERLERFFVRDDAVYRIRQSVRERVVFAPQNVLRDPPFSRLDIVTCRNLLIYLQPEIQRRVLSLLHFGLREGGALFLGTSETVSGAEELFAPIDKKSRIFRRVGPTRHHSVEISLTQALTTQPSIELPAVPRASLFQQTARTLLEHHAPAAVTIDRDQRINYFFGNLTPFLAHPRGDPSLNLLDLVKPGLRAATRLAVQTAMQKKEPSSSEGWVEEDGTRREYVRIHATPLLASEESDLFVVSFQRGAAPIMAAAHSKTQEEGSESELHRVRDELQSTVEELQTSNEELKAAHEEVVSTNEELQSTNEELETGREEMQSLNEELSTVNSQLQAKVEEYQNVSNDMTSLLASTDIAVLFLDGHFRIRRFTPKVRTLLDVIASDVGRPLSDLARKFHDPALLVDAADVLEDLTPAETEVRAENDRWYARRITPYRTSDNRIDGVVITFVDITERHRALESLRASASQFDKAIELAPIPILIQTSSGQVLRLSRAWTEITGQSTAHIPSMDAWVGRIVEPEAAAEIRGYLKRLHNDESPVLDLEFSYRADGSNLRYWRLRASSPGRLDEGDRIIMFAAVDITDSKSAELRLAESKRAIEIASAHKDSFIANMSHELRTPLANILAWSRILLEDKSTDAERRQAADIIARNAESQRRLIDDLLDTTRIAAGKLRLNITALNPAETSRAVLASIGPGAAAKQLTIDSDISDELGVVAGDPGRFEQIVWNLLSNAVKFTPRGGRITLSLTCEGPFYALTVKDTGQGIARDFLETMFVPFSQGVESAPHSKVGLGLGLSIVRGLVELQGGTVRAASDGPGKGSTFTVRLPRIPWTADHAARMSAQFALPHGTRVLLVEDNPDTLLAFTTLLQQDGVTVMPAHDGKQALELFMKTRPDIIASDVSMPGMNGIQLIAAVRQVENERNHPRTPALALSAHTSAADRAAAADAGFDRFLAKPCEPAFLVSQMANLLHERR